ncbi:hypothetical protein [Roseimicrobium sp. ORNL1]|uniref:hypothetical protein n=1 Tax=Roseimicrobium sp. ORNL1 TaxID=2711231 RepID=UPI00198264EA|nr:hypothetical protein [Roseimicrobium sp. ORNL1]
MAADKPPKTSRLKMALGVIVLIGAHLVLAPHTVRWQQEVQFAARQRWAEHKTKQFVDALRDSKVACREDLLPCVQAFKDHLASRHIKLRVLLRPIKQDLVGADGKLPTEPTPTALAMTTAEHTLRKAGIRTVNLMPDIYKAAALHPEWPVMAPDNAHFSNEVVSVMAQTLCASLEDWQKNSAGRNMLLVGDCYAVLTAAELKKGTTLPGISSQWKNSGDSVMAFEVSRIPAEMIPRVREIYWFLASQNVIAGSAAPLPLPSPLDPSAPPDERIRTVLAQVTKITQVSKDLCKNAPYPNAMALHQFTTEKGETLLAVVPIMENRSPLPSIYWVAQQWLQVTLQPWDAATRATPSLGREQILDDIQDFATDRYYVTGWLNPQ